MSVHISIYDRLAIAEQQRDQAQAEIRRLRDALVEIFGRIYPSTVSMSASERVAFIRDYEGRDIRCRPRGAAVMSEQIPARCPDCQCLVDSWSAEHGHMLAIRCTDADKYEGLDTWELIGGDIRNLNDRLSDAQAEVARLREALIALREIVSKVLVEQPAKAPDALDAPCSACGHSRKSHGTIGGNCAECIVCGRYTADLTEKVIDKDGSVIERAVEPESPERLAEIERLKAEVRDLLARKKAIEAQQPAPAPDAERSE